MPALSTAVPLQLRLHCLLHHLPQALLPTGQLKSRCMCMSSYRYKHMTSIYYIYYHYIVWKCCSTEDLDSCSFHSVNPPGIFSSGHVCWYSILLSWVVLYRADESYFVLQFKCWRAVCSFFCFWILPLWLRCVFVCVCAYMCVWCVYVWCMYVYVCAYVCVRWWILNLGFMHSREVPFQWSTP